MLTSTSTTSLPENATLVPKHVVSVLNMNCV